MKNKTWLALVFFLASFTGNGQVNFINGDWNEALTRAKKENKYIFLDAMTDWCHWCKEMDAKTFPQPDVTATMNAKFVAVKMDMEKGYGVKLCMKYRVSGFPTFLVFNPDGRLVYRATGYLEPADLIAALNTSLEPGRSSGFKGISENVDLAFPSFYTNTFKGNESGKVTKPEAAEIIQYLEGQKDLFSEVNWSVMTRFIKQLPKYQQFILDNRAAYEKLYGKEEVDDRLQAIINASFETAVKNKDENQLKKVIADVDKYLDDANGKIKSSYYITYYKETEQWIKMDKMVMESIRMYGIDESLNEYAWAVYENCDEAVVIKDAIEWMKQLCDKNPSYPSLDTYAALLYKDKQYTHAEQIATKAIETGKGNKEDVKETEMLLEKIKSRQAR